MMQAAGPEYPQIWHMFAFRPESDHPSGALHAGDHAGAGAAESLAAGVDCGIHFGAQSLPVLTEVSRRGRGRSFGEGEPARRLTREEFVAGVMRDLETSGLSEKRRKRCSALSTRVNHHSRRRLRRRTCSRCTQWAGTTRQIYYAITVCALFSFYNRWIDASGRAHAIGRDAPPGRKAVGQRRLCQEVSRIDYRQDEGASAIAGGASRSLRGRRVRQLWRRCWYTRSGFS